MNLRSLLPLLLLLVAATTIDQFDADFALGNTSNTNVTNNSVQLAGEPGNYSLSGTYNSSIKDIGSNPVATIAWTAASPAGTSILVSGRLGNTSTPDASWSGWSSSYTQNAGSQITGLGRYYQYRLQLGTTDQNTTPAVQSVTVTYTEQGPTVTAATDVNAVLNSETTGAYNFTVDVEDTASLTSVQAQYRIGSDSYGAFTDMTLTGGRYSILIPEPAGGWVSRKGELLRVRVQANNSRSLTETVIIQDLIDAINHAPLLWALPDLTPTERQQITFNVSATDEDGDTLTFTPEKGSATSTGATTADITWTPTNLDVGVWDFTVTVSDGITTDSETFTVNVTDVNDAPELDTITSETGYYGDRIVFELTAADLDFGENLTWTVSPPLFSIEQITTSTNTSTYEAVANFTALDDEKGFHNLTFTVRDAINSSSQNATLNISYCGDNICQERENRTSCTRDCYVTPYVSRLALEIPGRLCANSTINITIFNASRRDDCFIEGKTYEWAAFCEKRDGVDLTLYKIENTRRIEAGTLSSNTEGIASWKPTSTGRYKIIAEDEGYTSTEQLVTVLDCTADINLVENVIESKKPNIEATPLPTERPPELERPEIVKEETTLLEIIIWYLIIPLCLAALLFTGTYYYGMYKDTDPRILQLRIVFWEWRQRIEPTIKPYFQRGWAFIAPVAVPFGKAIWNNGGKELWTFIMKQLRKLDRRPRG